MGDPGGIVLAANAGPRVPSGSVTLKRRCTYRPSVICLIVNKLLSLSLSLSLFGIPKPRESGSMIRADCRRSGPSCVAARRATRPNGEWRYSTRSVFLFLFCSSFFLFSGAPHEQGFVFFSKESATHKNGFVIFNTEENKPTSNVKTYVSLCYRWCTTFPSSLIERERERREERGERQRGERQRGKRQRGESLHFFEVEIPLHTSNPSSLPLTPSPPPIRLTKCCM